MTGKEWRISDERLEEILAQEFDIWFDGRDGTQLEKARSAIEIYESLEGFLEQTGWRRDNPELAEECYLTENRICRWVDGKFMYVSKLVWEGNC